MTCNCAFPIKHDVARKRRWWAEAARCQPIHQRDSCLEPILIDHLWIEM